MEQPKPKKKIGRPIRDLTGQRVGRVVVVRRDETSHPRRLRWVCLCDCGEEVTCFATNLAQQQVASCGCHHRERIEEAKRRTEKACSICKVIKPLDGYVKTAASTDGHNAACKPCGRWRERAGRYGIDRQTFLGMLESQDGKCANPGCHREVGEKGHIDHNHETGAVRAVLCGGCNTALGQLGECPKRISGLEAYLISFS